jgi:hypothetical protein
MLRIVTSREGDEIEFEDWLLVRGNRESGSLIQGRIDKEGSVLGTIVKILAALPPEKLGESGTRGIIEGDQWNLDQRNGKIRNVVKLKLVKEKVAAKAVNLLALIDPKKHAVGAPGFGKWSLPGGLLMSSDKSFCRLQLPYAPPQEYRLEIVAARAQGDGGLATILVMGNHQTSAILGGEKMSRSGLILVDRKDLLLGDPNETSCAGNRFPDEKARKILYTVRKNHVSVSCDGKSIIDWKGDPRRLGLRPDQNIPDRGALYIDTTSSFVISKIEVTPIQDE